MPRDYSKMVGSKEDRSHGNYNGPLLHERIFRKVKQDNMNEHRYLMRKEKLIQKEVRFIKSRITMEKKFLTNKSMISAAKVRKLEQEDNLIKGKKREKSKHSLGPPNTEKRSRKKKDLHVGKASKQIKSELDKDHSDDEGAAAVKNNVRPPPLLPPIYRQKVVFPQRSLVKGRKTDPVKVEDLYDCRYLRLSKRQQLEREVKK